MKINGFTIQKDTTFEISSLEQKKSYIRHEIKITSKIDQKIFLIFSFKNHGASRKLIFIQHFEGSPKT
jgi:hypothetical protein